MRSRFALALTMLLLVPSTINLVQPAIAQSQRSVSSRYTERARTEGDRLFDQGVRQSQASQYQEALQSFEQALRIFREIGDQRKEVTTLYNIAAVYDNLEQPIKALEYCQKALSAYRALGDRVNQALLLNAMGRLYKDLGQYAKALDAHQQSLQLAQQLKNLGNEAAALSNIGEVYVEIGQAVEALEFLGKALTIQQQLKDRDGEGTTLSNMASVYRSLRQYDKTLEIYEKVLVIRQQLRDQDRAAIALSNIGEIYTNLKNYPKALESLEKALVIQQQRGNLRSETVTLTNVGYVYATQGQYSKALKTYQTALTLSQKIKEQPIQVNILGSIGGVLRRLNRNREAEERFYQAIAIKESFRPGLSDRDKVAIDNLEENKVYSGLQQALIAQNKIQPALEVSERGRARAFVELLASRLPTNLPGIKPLIQAPDLAQLKQIAQIQNATLVEYSIIYEPQGGYEKELYVWTIQPNGQIAFRRIDVATVLPKQCPSIAQLVTQSRDAIGARGWDQNESWIQPIGNANPCLTLDSKQNLATLHKLLIEPIKDLLPTDPDQTIVFVPQGSLFLVPFPALLDANGKYLIEQHTIQTAPSIQLLAQTHKLKTTPKGTGALIVGNPTMPKLKDNRPIDLADLPGSEREAKAIAPLFNTKALSHKAATKAEIFKQITTARIIHLSTHGLFDDRDGLKSAIVLAPTATDSGFLTAEEILKLNLKAELVVLSACNSGRGRITGDGVVGLSRSFIAAGVPSVLVSLWSVPDAPTAELMTEFYTQLRSRPNKAQALRQAMLKTMQTHPEPKNWAAFTLIGEE